MTDPKLVAASAISLAVSLFAIFSLRPLARRFGLIDKPDGRKQHSGRVPLIGGLCFFLGMLVGLCYLGYLDHFTMSLVSGSVLIVAVGAVDDYHDLGVRTRLVIETCIVGWIIAVTTYHIDNLGPLFGPNDLPLGWLGIPLTLFAVIGLINAYNMLDGIDGLAAALAMTTIGSILLMGDFSGVHPGVLLLLEVLFAALIPYVCVNLGWPDGRKVFMGDAGSTLIGFLLAWGLIYLSHSSVQRLAPVDVLWCVALPVMDTLAVIYRRMRLGKSPFKPDRQHLHHLLLDAGLPPRAALLAIVGAAGLLTLLGYALRDIPDLVSALAFIAVALAYVLRGDALAASAGRLGASIGAKIRGLSSAGTDDDFVVETSASEAGWEKRAKSANGANGTNGHGAHMLPAATHAAWTNGYDNDEASPMRALCVVPSLEDALVIASLVRNMTYDDRFEPALCAEPDTEPMLEALNLHADFSLQQEAGIGEPGQVTASALDGMERLLSEAQPDVVLVPVNSPAAVATSLAARTCDIPVVCIGEEPRFATTEVVDNADADRRIVRTLASLHVTSSESTGRELIAGGIAPECVLVARSDRQVLEALNGLHATRVPAAPGMAAANRNAMDGIHGVREAS